MLYRQMLQKHQLPFLAFDMLLIVEEKKENIMTKLEAHQNLKLDGYLKLPQTNEWVALEEQEQNRVRFEVKDPENGTSTIIRIVREE